MIRATWMPMLIACCIIALQGCSCTSPINPANHAAQASSLQALSDEALTERIYFLNQRRTTLNLMVRQQKTAVHRPSPSSYSGTSSALIQQQANQLKGKEREKFLQRERKRQVERSRDRRNRQSGTLYSQLEDVKCELELYRMERDRRMSAGDFNPEFRPGVPQQSSAQDD